MTGVVYSVSIWLTIRPPTIVMPSGRRNSEPAPPPIARGTPPSAAHIPDNPPSSSSDMRLSLLLLPVLLAAQQPDLKYAALANQLLLADAAGRETILNSQRDLVNHDL